MKHKKTLLLGACFISGSYGFIRGCNSYDYYCNKYKKTYFYNEALFNGLTGTFLYTTPIVLFIIPKELYRLEVNLRGLEEEKNTYYYNNL